MPSPPRTYRRPVPKTFSLFARAMDTLSIVQADRFVIPFADGTQSTWSTVAYPNFDGTQNNVVSWGYNTQATTPLDPAKPMLELTLETNYAKSADARQMEAYLQFRRPDGAIRRPVQFEFPFEGPEQDRTVVFTMSDFLSFLDETGHNQRVKVYKAGFALAHDLPLFFSDTDGCAGCYVDVGLRPFEPGQLAIITNLGERLGDLRVAAVRAVSLSGDGGAITSLSASNLTSGTVPEVVLPAAVALADRATTFLFPQTFLASGPPTSPGVVIEGTETNMAPALSIANTFAPVNRAWKVLTSGATGAFAVADATAGDVVRLSIDTKGTVATSGDVAVGGKINVAEGEGATVGQVVLMGGVATVMTRAVKTDSRIFVSHAGITGQPGILYSTEIRDGESFEIRSTSSTDDSPVNYWVIN